MENKLEDVLFERLDGLNIDDTDLLLKENINLKLNTSTRRRIEQLVNEKAGYYKESNLLKDKISNIFCSIFFKKKMAFAISAAILLSLGGGGYAYAKTPVAYVSLDINPSLELGVNAFDKVVSAEAYNEDGKKVLEGTNLINYDVDKAVITIISNAISDGYIKEDGSSAIEVTTATNKEGVANKLEESLKETVNETLEDNDVEAEVETENVALTRREEARQFGMTPGKLNLIQKLQELDSNISIEDYRESSVKDIMEKANELRRSNNSENINSDANTSMDSNDNGDIYFNNNSASEKNKNKELSNTSDDLKSDKTEKNNNGNDRKEENSNSSKENKGQDAYDKKENKNVQGNNNSSKLENNKGKSKNN